MFARADEDSRVLLEMQQRGMHASGVLDLRHLAGNPVLRGDACERETLCNRDGIGLALWPVRIFFKDLHECLSD
ncbi:hypothetical protein PQQ51_23360 [Paraburkholderia xenovorans]|uniref:hypothetical protein n=1 Tax=Paraburkholderia xenovorans TaxID=36873 RepID=UPI0038B85BA1